MEADFSGWATKAGLRCTDGRTIAPEAFKHQDTLTVPLVWQHGHKDLENILGHAILENRPEGVYCNAYFNNTKKATHAKEMVRHKDITRLSIWANDLIEKGKTVLHGAIREVSLVLSGANPGAVIDNVSIRHSDDPNDVEILEDEAIIMTGLSFEHTNMGENMTITDTESKDFKTVYDSMDETQKGLVHSLIGDALNEDSDNLEHAADETVGDIYNSLSDKQKQVVNFMIGEALSSSGNGNMAQSDISVEDNDDSDDNNGSNDNNEEGNEVSHHNVFENGTDDKEKPVISHADFEGIKQDAEHRGSLKAAIRDYGLQHGITDIDVLFPDAVATSQTPEFMQRRIEWVASFLGATTKSPFNRIKTFAADLTLEDARAKGYVKGELKKEEFFGVTHRTTTPQTIYKKQALDRDDVVDITSFDVVAWLKAEMRLMLDEEIARAALIGDGRDISHEDKIQESNIRPIASDHELFVTTVNVNLTDASSSVQEVIDAVITNRKFYKGTGVPNFYTSESMIARFLTLKDGFQRQMYKTLEEVAAVLRVSSIIPVEAMDDEDDLIGIIVNPVDYTMGATAGGEVSMFDDFDIDYNKQKYLIETRLCGALTRLKSALVLREVTGTLVTPTAPTFDEETGALTIHDTTHVTYKRTDTDATVTNGASPYTIASGDSITIQATAATGYYFDTSEVDDWTFTAL